MDLPKLSLTECGSTMRTLWIGPWKIWAIPTEHVECHVLRAVQTAYEQGRRDACNEILKLLSNVPCSYKMTQTWLDKTNQTKEASDSLVEELLRLSEEEELT